MPALAASKDREKRAECASNLRQICVANFVYAADRNDYLPPLKWRDGNWGYSYEMFHYSVGVMPPNYEAGPYNLGSLWKNNVLVDGRVYYCPADLNNDVFTYAFYSVKTNWPFGIDPARDTNPGYVRAGYTYYPQSRKTQSVLTAIGRKSVPGWPDYSTSPEPFRSWLCVPPFKQTEIDQTKSMVADFIYRPDFFLHKSGNTVLGINAGFGDGHVAWQGFKVVTDGFNLDVLFAISGGGDAGGKNFRYAQSCWRP